MTDDVGTEMELYDQDADLPVLDQFAGDDAGQWDDPRYGRVSTSTRPSISYVNESGMPDDFIDEHFRRRGNQEVASVIEKWSQSLALNQPAQTLDMFNRGRGIDRDVHPHAVMARTAWAVENDDVLSTTADVVEGLMWQKCRFEMIDDDEQDVWNQWARDVNLDEFLRACGREDFKVSQFYVGLWWDRKVYKVRDDPISSELEVLEFEKEKREFDKKSAQRDAFIEANKSQPGFIEPPPVPEPVDPSKGRGNRSRKKTFPIQVPTALTIFDPTKVLPVGTLMFGRERFAYIASRGESEAFDQVMAGQIADDTVLQLIERKYTPTEQDKVACADLGVDAERLYLFKKDSIFRYTSTKSDYERYAQVRMKPVLPLIEMKSHLRQSDRASLIGNTNFIVVITKGSDKFPAKAAEIENLQAQAKVIARLPVLIGDHRLNVEIVSPSTDNTLIESRWQTLDSRLVFIALRSFSPVTQGGSSSGAGVSEMSRVVAKGLESRRHMILRAIERGIFGKIMDRNEEVLDEFPTLEFTPKRITLDFEKDVIASILKLRDRGDISRETTLEELDFDQDTEVLRRARERALYDDTFQSQTPFSSPALNPYGAPVKPEGGGPMPIAPVPPGADPAQPAAVPAAVPAKKTAAKRVAKKVAKNNIGPKGQPRTEGGRPSGVTEPVSRKTAGS